MAGDEKRKVAGFMIIPTRLTRSGDTNKYQKREILRLMQNYFSLCYEYITSTKLSYSSVQRLPVRFQLRGYIHRNRWLIFFCVLLHLTDAFFLLTFAKRFLLLIFFGCFIIGNYFTDSSFLCLSQWCGVNNEVNVRQFFYVSHYLYDLS